MFMGLFLEREQQQFTISMGCFGFGVLTLSKSTSLSVHGEGLRGRRRIQAERLQKRNVCGTLGRFP